MPENSSFLVIIATGSHNFNTRFPLALISSMANHVNNYRLTLRVVFLMTPSEAADLADVNRLILSNLFLSNSVTSDRHLQKFG